jgi:hypothetical protein
MTVPAGGIRSGAPPGAILLRQAGQTRGGISRPALPQRKGAPFTMGPTVQNVTNHVLITITAEELQSLADRLFARGISTISTCDAWCRGDLVTASRVIRELARRVDRATGRTLQAVVIQGG